MMLIYTGDPDEVDDWIFTFGYGHVHPLSGEALDDCYVRIRSTFSAARHEMFERFGVHWAFQYGSREIDLGSMPLVEVGQSEEHVEALKARRRAKAPA